MKTARAARIFVYRDCVASSLRKRALLLKASDIGPAVTPAGLKRVQREMEKLAAWLEAKAAKYAAAAAMPDAMPQTPAGLDDDHALIAGDSFPPREE